MTNNFQWKYKKVVNESEWKNCMVKHDRLSTPLHGWLSVSRVAAFFSLNMCCYCCCSCYCSFTFPQTIWVKEKHRSLTKKLNLLRSQIQHDLRQDKDALGAFRASHLSAYVRLDGPISYQTTNPSRSRVLLNFSIRLNYYYWHCVEWSAEKSDMRM